MFRRIIKPSNNSSFFIFGARGTGKTTWLKAYFKDKPHLWLDLLSQDLAMELALNPGNLAAKINQVPQNTDWVVIDEIQKNPQLLDTVHQLIEEKKIKFALTGSSARKLKRGAANLLAGRAFVYHMYPLIWSELGAQATLDEILHWGALPSVFQFSSVTDKAEYLRSYATSYLAEEIVAEQLVRQLLPFKRFLPVAAQNNGQITNYAKISKDVGADDKTIQAYYEILEDTHMGFRLFPYHSSFRKRLSQKPKFYFFDIGVARTLSRVLDVPLTPQTSVYGDTFEHFVMLEFWRTRGYFYPDTELTYIKTKDDAEVDLVIDHPGQAPILIEIKSTRQINESQIGTLKKIAADIPGATAYCLSQDPAAKQWGKVICLPWDQGLNVILPKGNFYG